MDEGLAAGTEVIGPRNGDVYNTETISSLSMILSQLIFKIFQNLPSQG